MKKIISLILALTLILSMSITAFATETNSGKLEANNASQTINVTGTFNAGGAAATKVSVNITWDEMSFTYTGASQGEWNPNDHAYTGSTAGGWSTETATIVVVNHSNTGVTATLSFTSAVEGVIGAFTENSMTENDNVLELQTAFGTDYNSAPSATAEFGISGAAITESKTLGTITVAIATN